MKKIKSYLTVLFVFVVVLCSAKIISGQINRVSLDGIIAEIPEVWWEGGWDMLLPLNQFIDQNPGDKQACARAQYWIGCNYYANRDYNRAIQEYETIFKLYSEAWGECAKSQFEIGQVYLYKLNDYEKALEAYQNTLNNYPQCAVSAEAQRMVAYTYSKMSNNEKAKEEYSKVVTSYPKAKLEIAKAYWELGELLFKESTDDKLSVEAKNEKMKNALSSYKNAYLYCPADDVEVSEWIIDSVIRTFKFLDGNADRADAFIRYQRYANTSDSGAISTKQTLVYDPLSGF
jgi:tetratricopeptide (TPR) repeat protein